MQKNSILDICVCLEKKINLINSLYLNKFLTRNELDKINDEFKNMKIKKINSFGYLHKL